jgi:hypothetical protein
MLEHMIDPMRLPDRGGVSVVEAALRGLLAGRGARPVVELAPDFRAHGRQPVAAGPAPEEELPPAVAAFAGLLEAGAAQLAAARAAARESGRQAAVQARALAAFAAARPGALLEPPRD